MNEYSVVMPGILASSLPTTREYLEEVRRKEGVRTIISLTEDPLPKEIRRGFHYYHIPIEDFSVPEEGQIWEFLEAMEESLKEGGVLVHCFGGIGRTGTMLAIYLVWKGWKPEDAIEYLRSIRSGSVFTPAQEMLVYHFAEQMRIRKDKD
ncbi:MAG: dual specificity protein phosphatase family protein [Thermoplasmata archaeon]|nr:dual specificity protein phosphatase family protein [Thermoplasmata archaeon]